MVSKRKNKARHRAIHSSQCTKATKQWAQSVLIEHSGHAVIPEQRFTSCSAGGREPGARLAFQSGRIGKAEKARRQGLQTLPASSTGCSSGPALRLCFSFENSGRGQILQQTPNDKVQAFYKKIKGTCFPAEMPTTQKTLMFLGGFLTSLGAVVVTCSILATQAWVTSTLAIKDLNSNGSVTISYGLFRGKSVQELDHGLPELDKNFKVLGTLSDSSPKTLHTVAILFLALSLAVSVLSSLLTFYNSVSNPYQTFLGPVGVYTWSGLSASFIFLTMVLFVGNTESNHLSEELSQKLYPEITLSGTAHTYGYSFWLIFLVIVLNIITVVIIIFYQKARYKQKQEQRKPMEYAPRDGILF